MSDFIKLRSAGAELFHADGQKDMTKLIVVLCNFAKVLKKKERLEPYLHQNTSAHREI
jgi:hypothetical protein